MKQLFALYDICVGCVKCLYLVQEFDARKDYDLLVGGSLWEYNVPSQCYLFTYLYMHPSARGKGLGVALALECWKEACRLEDEGQVSNHRVT